MQTWRRQTIIIGICFATVVIARVYFERSLAEDAPNPRERSGSGDLSLPASEARDTVVTLDTNP